MAEDSILSWAVMVRPCPHVSLGVDPQVQGIETTYQCPFCGPIRINWPE